MNLLAVLFMLTGLGFALVLVWLIYLTTTLDLLVKREQLRRRERVHGR